MPREIIAKILIVDDEVAQMKALCDTLRDHGYDTVGFASATAALKAIDETKFDLLLTDMMMPEMDGITLLQRAQVKDSNLVGIIMTGEGTIATAVESMKSGALDYILKPFRLKAILPVLDRALAVRKLRLENIELGKRVRLRTAELESANKELEAFSYSVSHDLRAPLRHILGFAEILEGTLEPKCTEDEKNYFNRIKAAAEGMGKLIDDLLAFSRTGRTELQRSEVNLQSVLKTVLHDIEPETEGRTIEWTFAELPTVHGDLAMLRQVLSNLLLNAIKYSRPRNPAKIEVGYRTEPNELIVFVRDNGVGFDMKFADKLFGVFQRLHRKDEFEGTGVGLANVRRIVARHGGRTWAESKPNEGATFYFSLPTS